MISEVVMPQMGADMVEGTIVKWLKHDGDGVTRGEIIAEIETDKANVEIEAFESGTFRTAIASEGDVIPVGQTIAIIAAPEDDISTYTKGAPPPAAPTTAPSAAPASEPAAAPPTPAPAPAPAATPREDRSEDLSSPTPAAAPPPTPASTPPPAASRSTQVAQPATRIRISPVARTLAEAHNIDPRTIHGTGPDGRIIRRDIEVAIAGAPAATKPSAPTAHGQQPTGTTQPSKMRQAIARRMSQSKREAPHYYLLVDIDMTDALEFRRQFNDTLAENARASINDLIVRACALALQRHPEFNATMAADQITPHDAQHVCIAIALEDGLIAPAILDAGTKTLAQIASESRDLAERAKTGALRPREITDGTFTITNLGAYGVETLIGIIQPPQTAILGVGTVTPQSSVREGAIVVRHLMKVALSADHRVTDGAQGAQFLTEIKRLLEHPLLLVL
jgi:pyruvate dehydrogenase E2 component (dihydrolipoamide acetyltransferase)